MLRPTAYLVWLAGSRPRHPRPSLLRTAPRPPQKPARSCPMSGSIRSRLGYASDRRWKICPAFGCARSILRPTVYLVWLAGNRRRRLPLSPRRTTPRPPQKPHHIPGGSGQPAPTAIFEGGSEPHWPWLRAPADEVPGFRLNPDGSVRTDEPGAKVRLMAGAFTPLEPQEQPNDVAGSNGVTSSDVVPSPPAGAPLSTTSAASIAVPASAGAAVDLAGLIARAAPAVAGAGSAAAGALPFLFIPTNTQSETTDLGDGLRARVRPGQRTVEIERRVHNGLLGTGIGAKWETLPVEAQQVVGRDGSANTVINHEQLNRALGQTAPVQSKDAGTSAMAQPPKDGEPQQQPPASTGSGAEEANKPGIGNPPAAQSLAPSRIDAKVLEEAKQRDPEEERVLACRAVRAMPGQPAPSGQYDGRGGIETAVGIRVAPGFPAPKGGYDYGPDYLRHWNGYKGELELKNRIEKSRSLREVRSLRKSGRRSRSGCSDHWPRRSVHGMGLSFAHGGAAAWAEHGQFCVPPSRRRKNLCVERHPLARRSARYRCQSAARIE